MMTSKNDEKWIDDIRDGLYIEMQTLGKTAFERQKHEQFFKLAKEYGWKVIPSKPFQSNVSNG